MAVGGVWSGWVVGKRTTPNTRGQARKTIFLRHEKTNRKRINSENMKTKAKRHRTKTNIEKKGGQKKKREKQKTKCEKGKSFVAPVCGLRVQVWRTLDCVPRRVLFFLFF